MRSRCELSLCVFLLFLYICHASKSYRKPVINRKSPFEILEPNHNITLYCQGYSPLNWTLPNVSKDKLDWTRFIIQDAEPEDQNYKYASTLQIVNISYPFVGFYYCHEKNESANSDKIYLYVNETEHLSIAETSDVYIVTGVQYQNVTIPCKPTSPYVNVTLKQGRRDVDLQKGTRYYYDPMYGIITNDTDKKRNGIQYTCYFARNEVKMSTLVSLDVEKPVDHIAIPELIDQSEGHAIEGNTLVLICKIETENKIDFNWVTPKGPIDIIEHPPRMMINRDGTKRYIIREILSISNVSIDMDRGTYSCNVTDRQNHSSSARLYVNIFSVDESYITMSPINNSYIVVPSGQPSVQLGINIDSHPRPTIKWFNNENDTIQSSSRYEIDYKMQNNMTFLNIKNVTIKDTGFYRILANNSKTIHSLGIFLNVTERPSVRIDTDQFHLINTPSIVKCFAIANPEPHFEWEYKDCLTDVCSFMPINATGNVTKIGEINYISETTMISPTSGSIRCFAKNSQGFENATARFYVSDVKNGFNVFGLDSTVNLNEKTMEATVALGDTIKITCGASPYMYRNISWFFKNQTLKNTERYLISYSLTQYSEKVHLEIAEANVSDNGLYTCQATGLNGESFFKNITFIIADPKVPVIDFTNMKDVVEMNIPEELVIICKISGIPKPHVTWFKDDVEFNPSEPERIQVDENKEKITFKYTNEKDEGAYKCEGKNRMGLASKQQSIKFKNLPENNPRWLIYVTIFLSLMFLIAIIFIVIKIRKEKILQRELQILGLTNFVKGAVQNINTELGINDQAELLPYDKKWEFPIENLEIGKQLGSGAFGVVVKATARNIIEGEPITTVAIKKARKVADSMYIRALASELKIMVHLGKHLNIVNLLGACTKNIAKRELLVIVEYCQYGNLQNYLLRHRDVFIDQVDRSTGEVDFSKGQGYINRSYSLSSDKSNVESPALKYASLVFPDCNRGKSGRSTIPEGISPSLKYASLKFFNSNDSILPQSSSSGEYRENVQTGATGITTISEEDDVILSNNSEQPAWRSNYKGDYKGNVNPISTKDLLVWAFQVARGMEYLASRKVLHGDLAARNILLADNNIVKICDFGLAKSMYNNDNYKKRGKGPLPLKWMAIESIGDSIFSTQSDVWSFGIVLWEFFSLGKSPYPGVEANEKLYEQLLNGYRMAAPEYAPKEIYNMMTKCWKAEPLLRPSFTKLAEEIGNLIDESSRKYFVDLNKPYLKVNTERLESGENDYLTMVSSPTFEALSSPHYVNENIEQPHPGYLTMDPISMFSPRIEEGKVFDFNVDNRKRSEDGDEFEVLPMLPKISDSSPDVPLQTPVTPDCFSNPMYHVPPTILEKTGDDVNDNEIVKTTDNYVNMLAHKGGDHNSSPNDNIGKVDSEKKGIHFASSNIRNWQRVQV